MIQFESLRLNCLRLLEHWTKVSLDELTSCLQQGSQHPPTSTSSACLLGRPRQEEASSDCLSGPGPLWTGRYTADFEGQVSWFVWMMARDLPESNRDVGEKHLPKWRTGMLRPGGQTCTQVEAAGTHSPGHRSDSHVASKPPFEGTFLHVRGRNATSNATQARNLPSKNERTEEADRGVRGTTPTGQEAVRTRNTRSTASVLQEL